MVEDLRNTTEGEGPGVEVTPARSYRPPIDADGEEWLGPEAAARLLNLPTHLIYEFIRQGNLPAQSSPVRVRRSDLQPALQAQRVEPGSLTRSSRKRHVCSGTTPVRSGSSLICDICGFNTVTEWFIVPEPLWSSIGLLQGQSTLCVGCFERLLGRRLTPGDFDGATAARLDPLLASDRLLSRMDLDRTDLVEADAELPEMLTGAAGRRGRLKRGPALRAEEWVGAERAAEQLGVSLAALLRLASNGRIVVTWHPIRVQVAELRAYLDQERGGA